jgi:hypothetical protein
MSWMVGRNVVVWQHPKSFWKGLAITAEPTGRGKCKATRAPFAPGELRLSAQAHTTTNHFKLACAFGAVIKRVQLADTASCDLAEVDGVELLSPAERDLLTGASSSPPSLESIPAVEPTPETKELVEQAETRGAKAETSGELKQPRKGIVTKTKGKVAWKFAGHVCFGTLLPSQESATHCYARTHKGNTKTLSKGGSSWWMLDE